MGDPNPRMRQASFHQSTFFWGGVGAVLTVVITVIAAPNVRWVLVLAWPFAGLATYEFSKAWTSYRKRWAITFIGSTASGVALFYLYLALTPTLHPPSDTVSGDQVEPAMDQTLLLECDWAQPPETVPNNGFRALVLQDQRGGANNYSSQQGGTKLVWGADVPKTVELCRFTNFGPKPLLNVGV